MPGRLAAATAALALAALPASGFERPPGQKACAAFDLHLVGVIEQLGEAEEVSGEVLAEATETMLRARAACRAGRIESALGLYGEIKLGRVRFGWLK